LAAAILRDVIMVSLLIVLLGLLVVLVTIRRASRRRFDYEGTVPDSFYSEAPGRLHVMIDIRNLELDMAGEYPWAGGSDAAVKEYVLRNCGRILSDPATQWKIERV
jgi:hypothetical protein